MRKDKINIKGSEFNTGPLYNSIIGTVKIQNCSCADTCSFGGTIFWLLVN